MQINMTLERETKNTIRFAEDDAGQPGAHPGTPVIGTLYLQKAAHAALGAAVRITVSVEPRSQVDDPQGSEVGGSSGAARRVGER